MKRYTFKLNANETSVYGIVGDFIHIFSAIGDLTVKTDNGDIIVLPQQMGWHTKHIFKSVGITSSIDQTITFYAGFGDINDGRTIIVGEIDASSGSTLTTWDASPLTGGGAIEVLGKNLSRKGIIFSNNNFNELGCVLYVGDSWIGPFGGGGGMGTPILLGEKLIITTGAKGEWWAYAATAINQNISAFISVTEII